VSSPRPQPWRMSTAAMLIAAFVFASTAAPADAQSGNAAEPGPYRILVSNDDGLNAAGLRPLVRELSKLGEVVVCVPDGPRPGTSQAVTIFGANLIVTKHEVDGAAEAWSVSGMPADAVHFAIRWLGRKEPFDVVVTGINGGANTGNFTHYSGTIGGAMQAAGLDVPAVAVSRAATRDEALANDYSVAATFTARFIERMREKGFERGVVYAINVPAKPAFAIKGVLATRMGGQFARVPIYRPIEEAGDRAVYKPIIAAGEDPPDDSDTAALRNEYIAITPLRFDWTDDDALPAIDELNLKVDDGDAAGDPVDGHPSAAGKQSSGQADSEDDDDNDA